MDGMVEENGTSGSVDALVSQGSGSPIVVTSVHSVIQANQQSVIQTATPGAMLTKGNVILLSKPNSVIQTTQGNLQTLQVVVEAGSDESLSANEDSPKRGRHDALTRRPSYRKILNDIAGGKVESSGSDCDSNLDSELSSNSLSAHYQAVLPSTAIQLNSQGEMHNMPTLTMSNATSASGTILQYASQDGQFFVPVVTQPCESSFTRGYCTAFPNQGSPSPKKLTCKMGRIIDTTHCEICGSGACASFCLDATEVAEEKDPEREWCISILKESKLLALSTGNAAAMEHPGVVGDGKCNKKCKVCGTLEDSISTLICDMCEESFHMSCCNPKVVSIPMKDNWYCTTCRKKRKRPVIKYSIESGENEHGLKFKTGVLDKGVHDKGANEKGGDLLWRMLQDDGAYTTQVRIGNEYQADVPIWTGKVTDSVESPFMGELISLEEKILEQELAKRNMENGVWPKDWKPAKFLLFGSKENWLQCRAVLYYEGELCPDGRKAKQDIICGKWRRAPFSQIQNDDWDCSCAVVWDPVHADCAVPQEMETEDILKLLKASEIVFPECKLSKEDWGFERDE